MYRELQPLREALSQELKADLFPAVAGVEPDKLLETYLNQLTMFIGVDVADQTLTKRLKPSEKRTPAYHWRRRMERTHLTIGTRSWAYLVRAVTWPMLSARRKASSYQI